MRLPRLLKAQAASLVSSAVDFLVTIALVEGLHRWYVLATVLGNMAGGLTNFYLGRLVVFEAASRSAQAQGARYFITWLGSMLLNAAGLFVLTRWLGLHYIVSKTLVSLLVGVGFNYFMQLHFVFKKP